jgi:nucleotide-binding universal stress UspA family protein
VDVREANDDRRVNGQVRTIVVGVDGSERALEALGFAARLAQATGARLVVAGVYEYRSPWRRLGSGDRAMSIAREAAAAARAGCDIRIAPAPSVAAGLKEIAAAESADLLVVGSRHRGHLGEALPGRVGHGLLSDPPCPIVLVAVGERARLLRHVGVLPGDEQDGPRAVALAAALASATGAGLRIYEPRDGWPVYRSIAESTGVRDVERAPSAADDVAAGRLDALVVPDWPHGLMGRLRPGGRPAPNPPGRCVLIVAPPRAHAPAAGAPAQLPVTVR